MLQAPPSQDLTGSHLGCPGAELDPFIRAAISTHRRKENVKELRLDAVLSLPSTACARSTRPAIEAESGSICLAFVARMTRVEEQRKLDYLARERKLWVVFIVDRTRVHRSRLRFVDRSIAIGLSCHPPSALDAAAAHT